MDCQFHLDMAAAMQESEQLAILAEHEYANRINMLNGQLRRLRPDAQSLCVEDVGGQYRQGDCLFQAIRMQYVERSQQLPGVLKRHTYLESVKTFRHAIMEWVKDNLDRLQPLFHELKDPSVVSSIAQSRWGEHLELAAAATMLQCRIQIIPMKGNAPILVTPLYGTASGPILVLGWMNDKHYTSTQIRSRQSKAQPLDAEAVMAAAKSPAEQAADQGNTADAGQGPTVGPDKAEGAASKAATHTRTHTQARSNEVANQLESDSTPGEGGACVCVCVRVCVCVCVCVI